MPETCLQNKSLNNINGYPCKMKCVCVRAAAFASTVHLT